MLETKPTLGFRRFYWIPPRDVDFSATASLDSTASSPDVELLYFRLIIVGDGKIHY